MILQLTQNLKFSLSQLLPKRLYSVSSVECVFDPEIRFSQAFSPNLQLSDDSSAPAIAVICDPFQRLVPSPSLPAAQTSRNGSRESRRQDARQAVKDDTRAAFRDIAEPGFGRVRECAGEAIWGIKSEHHRHSADQQSDMINGAISHAVKIFCLVLNFRMVKY